MADEFIEGPELPHPQQGKWTDFAKDFGWTSPADAVKDSLERIRRHPTHHLSVAREELPHEPEAGDPLPLIVELKSMIRGGSIGRNPEEALVTVDEFLAVAPEIYGLNEDEITELREQTFPELEAWDAEMEAIELERRNQEIEEANRFILQTWTVDRFRVLREQVLPHAEMPDIQTVLDTFERFYGNDLVRHLDQAEEALADNDEVSQRRSRLEDAVTLVLGYASRLTRLHPEELRDIAETERYNGYLFLDSISPQLPVLDATFDEIATKQQNLKETGYHVSEDDEVSALHRREQAIGELRFGADNTHAIQDLESFLRGEGKQAHQSETYAVEQDDEDRS